MSQSHDCFLKEIANSLYQIYGQQIAELTIVFPNRRAGLFFKEYLNRIIVGPTFSPEIITIQELFSNISMLRLEEQLPMIFRLFKVYRNLSGSKESFDEFYLWGEMLLHDFDQVDKYQVDAELLFTNITDLKEIDEHFNDWNEERKEEIRQFWSSQTNGNQKRDQKEFSRLWQLLYPVYQKFKEELYAANTAYEGMLFRDAVENMEGVNFKWLDDKKIVVAGFNALNSCEKALFQQLQDRKCISFYWDYDQYYLGDINQEAALFMRENLNLFPQKEIPYGTDNFIKYKKIRLYHTPSQIGQAQIAADEVDRLGGESVDFDDTAIILCDEELLLPVLSAIPQKIGTINVTMGLPLRQTPLYSLINQLISLQKKVKKEGRDSLFHYRNVIDLLNNQLIQTIYPIECKSVVSKILKNNLLYVSEKELGITSLFCKIFIGRDTISDLAEYFVSILHELFQFWEKKSELNYSTNYQEYIYQVYLSLNKLNNILFKGNNDTLGDKDFLNKDTYFKLLMQYLNGVNVSFEGEPLAGLQVMGILETRTLDFKNIVLLSVNEGIMPKAIASGSFIPYHLRKGVGLPTAEEHNAMYAYYFYRLIQRAQSVTFVYNSGSNGLKTGEKSRFIHQLLIESPFDIEEQGIENTIDPMPVYPITVEKKGNVLQVLNSFLNSGKTISPTALDQYIQCPLSFYFKYIAHFKEEEEVAEEVDARIFGQLFHAVMESMYRPYLNVNLDEKILTSLINSEAAVEKALLEAFRVHFFKSESSMDIYAITGRNKLVYEVIKKMVLQTLRVDKNRVPFTIVGLEQQVGATMAIHETTTVVRIGGIIDRINSISGAYEIIDYKTGNVESSVGELEDLFDHQVKKRNKAALQTLIYCSVQDKMYPGNEAIYPMIYALKTIFKQEPSRLILKANGASEINYRVIKGEFEMLLIKLLEDIFNPELPFFQTTVEEHCQYCSFASICGKQLTQS